MLTLRAVKSIRFRYRASASLSLLFENFRLMCNEATRIALKEKPKNRFKLMELALPRLKQFGLQSHYALSACEVAYSAIKNKKRKSNPYFKKSFLKLDNQTYRLNHMLVRIPSAPRQFIFLTLEGSRYHLSLADDPTVAKGSITITDREVSISLSKVVVPVNSSGGVGVDINERNVTTSNTLGFSTVFDISDVAEIRARYVEIRAKIGRRVGQDRRTCGRLYSKYGGREKARKSQILHRISKSIVSEAGKLNLHIVMENLKGIRRLYRNGNGQGRSYRGRMNSWPYREIQRQIEYKATWNGIPLAYVSPRGTSSKCPCGSSLVELEGRRVFCPSCRKTEDRDVIASKNLMACVVPQDRPGK